MVDMKKSTDFVIIVAVAAILLTINLISLWQTRVLGILPMMILSATTQSTFVFPTFTTREIIIIALDVMSISAAVMAIYISGKIEKFLGRESRKQLGYATLIDGISATFTAIAIFLTLVPII